MSYNFPFNSGEVPPTGFPDVRVYPPTKVVYGEWSIEDYIGLCAERLYDDWVCDRRWEVEDLIKLLIWERERRDMGKKYESYREKLGV